MIRYIIDIFFELQNYYLIDSLLINSDDFLEELILFGRKAIFVGSVTLVAFCLYCLIYGYPEEEEEEKKKRKQEDEKRKAKTNAKEY